MNDKLKQLHEVLTQQLLDRVKSEDAKASDLNVARQFLKDNGIEALPVDNSPLKSLVDELPFSSEEEVYNGTDTN
jgi:hypothetical protein|tara:strand:+ start:128 stop:352 length:225 start_codon:yes stop_codon:yes gene_type:complete